ncbi:hypothetical protein [Roseibium alexandrii]|uniref:hypothetical protein n=1 Tax=Roseibium alexandrii TaxID=388408 RepID=UPI0037518EED
MTAAPKILPDLTAADRAFEEQLATLTDRFSMRILQRKLPDGVTPYELAARNKWSFCETLALITAAADAGDLKVRTAPDGQIRFVWLPGSIPPLTFHERKILKAACRDLADGPAEIWLTGLAHEFGCATPTVLRALDFLVSADLLSRSAKTYALTDLGAQLITDQEEPA